MNFQESTTILDARTKKKKKSLETYWMHHVHDNRCWKIVESSMISNNTIKQRSSFLQFVSLFCQIGAGKLQNI